MKLKTLPKGCTRVCSLSTDDLAGDDLDFEETVLYRAPDGRYVAEGHGGPRTMWARQDGQPGSWANGGGVKIVGEETAYEIMERADLAK